MAAADYAGLVERLRAATGPDRYLDALVARSIAGSPDGHWYDLLGKWTSDGTTPPVTASLDAAIALVERALPGMSWEVRKSGFGDPAQATLWNPRKQPMPGYDIRAEHRGGCAPVALLIALLLALEARANG